MLEWNWSPSTMVGACAKKIFKSLSNYINWKMNFSAVLSLFTNLVLKNLDSVFRCHTDSSIRIYNTISFSNLATMILVQYFLKLYNTHTGKAKTKKLGSLLGCYKNIKRRIQLFYAAFNTIKKLWYHQKIHINKT